FPISRSAGRRPKASAQIRTAGCIPVGGRMDAASHVPSGVLTSTFVSTTGNSAADVPTVAAAIPAVRDIAPKARRDSSLDNSSCSSRSRFSSVIVFLLFFDWLRTADLRAIAKTGVRAALIIDGSDATVTLLSPVPDQGETVAKCHGRVRIRPPFTLLQCEG